MISTTTTIQIIFMIGSILLMLGLALFTKTVYAVGVLPFIMMISPFVFQCVPVNNSGLKSEAYNSFCQK